MEASKTSQSSNLLIVLELLTTTDAMEDSHLTLSNTYLVLEVLNLKLLIHTLLKMELVHFLLLLPKLALLVDP